MSLHVVSAETRKVQTVMLRGGAISLCHCEREVAVTLLVFLPHQASCSTTKFLTYWAYIDAAEGSGIWLAAAFKLYEILERDQYCWQESANCRCTLLL